MSHASTVENLDIWGRRRLAYEIKKKSEGIYAVVNFTSTADATVELDRQLKLSEAVMRTKVLRADEAVVSIKPIDVPEITAAEIADTKPARAPRKPAAKKDAE